MADAADLKSAGPLYGRVGSSPTTGTSSAYRTHTETTVPPAVGAWCDSALASCCSVRQFPALQVRELSELFQNNKAWAARISRHDPEFFSRLSRQQSPGYLWIGCSDSRVPANEIVGLLPGELFVHRNIANLVVHTDLNCLSVMQFAVDVLKVRHIIVCGHYGCSGVQAALRKERLGLSDHWLRHLHDIGKKHAHILNRTPDDAATFDRLCELNVIEQVGHVCQSAITRDAWIRSQPLTVHGWIYDLRDGLLRDLNVTIGSHAEFPAAYDAAISALPGTGR